MANDLNDLDEIKTKIGKNIAKYRTKAGLSQLKLSLMVESDEIYISHLERGRRILSISMAYKISKAVKIELYELFK